MMKVVIYLLLLFIAILNSYSATPVACGDTLSAAGDYILAADDSTTSTCLTITGSGVNLDCQGYTLDGDYSGTDHGILVQGTGNTIVNCVMQDFYSGIYFSTGGTYNNVSNILTKSNSNGIYFSQGYNNVTNVTSIGDVIGASFSSQGDYNYFGDFKIINSTNRGISFGAGAVFNDIVDFNVSGSANYDIFLYGDRNVFTNGYVSGYIADITTSLPNTYNSVSTPQNVIVGVDMPVALVEPGMTYYLGADIYIPSSNGITIVSSDITLDCQGYTIDGNDAGSTYGAYIKSLTNVTIKNCVFNDFDYASYMYDSSSIKFYNTTFNSSGYGLSLSTNSDNNLFDNITVSNSNTFGVYFSGNTNNGNNFTNSFFVNDGASYHSLSMDTSTGNLFENTYISGYVKDASWRGNYVNVTENPNIGNASKTIYLVTKGPYVLTQNYSVKFNSAIFFWKDDTTLDCQNNYIIGDFTNNGYGLYINGPDNVTIANCNVKNFDYGLYLANINSGNFLNNSFDYNDWGINFAASAVGNIFDNISVSNNLGYGLSFSGGTNTANNFSNFNFSNHGIAGYSMNGNNPGSDKNYFDNGYVSGHVYSYVERFIFSNTTEKAEISNPSKRIHLISNGTYYLTEDFTTTAGAILFRGDNATLDCQGYTISGDGGSGDFGLDFTFASGVSVNNCTVENFQRGAYFYFSEFNTISDTKFVSNTYAGISFSPYSYNNTFVNINSTNNPNGLHIGSNDVKQNTVKNSYLKGNSNYDISATQGYNNYFFNNYLNRSSNMDSTSFNYFYNVTNFLGNYWDDVSACSDPSVNTSLGYNGFLYTVCDSNDYNIDLSLDKGVILAKELLPTPVVSFVSPTPADSEVFYGSSITINVSSDLTPVSCVLDFDSVLYPMTYSNGYCNVTLIGLVKGSYSYEVFAEYAGVNGSSTRNVVIESYDPFYIFPTLNDNAKVSSSSVLVNVSYNGESVTSCDLNLNNGTVISMIDSGDSCYGLIDFSSLKILSLSYNVSYVIDSQTSYLGKRSITFYPNSSSSVGSIFPSFGFGSLFIGLALVLLFLV